MRVLSADEPNIESPGRLIPYSDDSIANRFSEEHHGDLRYTTELGWLAWDGTRYRRVTDVEIVELARKTCRTTAGTASADEALSPPEKSRLSKAIASARTAGNVEKLARGDSRHRASSSEFDCDLYLLNTPGGTVDLRTGELRPHRREDMISKITNATPEGDCPLWLKFLGQATNSDAELEKYLQRFLGYALTGDTREECFAFLYGQGSNGKGTFMGTTQHVMGEYATSAAMDTFTESKFSGHPTDLAKLAGVRRVDSNEVDEGRRWNEAKLKELTGGDVISARFMRRDFFEFKPQFKPFISGNHRPEFKTVDDAIRRRVHLVPFTVTFTLEKRDTGLKEALRAESDGILNWMVKGCLQWQAMGGLFPPDSVLAATNDYFESEDTFSQWMGECCERDPDIKCKASALYKSFKAWKEARGEGVMSQKRFAGRLHGLGFIRDREESGSVWKGMDLVLSERCRFSASTGNTSIDKAGR